MRVIIDAGHGGSARAGSSSAFGSRGAHGTLEKEVTLDIARHVVARLGQGAMLTRSSDTNLTLGARAQLAAQRDADVFVSIHANSGPPEASGPETFVHPEAAVDSHRLADGVQRALERLRGRYGGVAEPRNGPLAVLSPRALGARTSACLVEVDYLSNPRSEARLRDPRERAAIGAAIASAIEEHVATRRRGTSRGLDASEFEDADQLGENLVNARRSDHRAVSTKEAAHVIVGELDSWSGTSPWNLDKAQVTARLRELVDNPILYRQASTPLCGPASFYSIWTLRDPAAFARHAVDLFKTGRAQIGAYAVTPGSSLLRQSYTATAARAAAMTRPRALPPQADWMLMGAIRNTEDDIFIWDGSQTGDTLSGITFPQELARWLSATGIYRTVDNRIGTGASALSSKGWPAATSLTPREGVDIVCLISASAFTGLTETTDAGGLFPNHYVILTGAIQHNTAQSSPDGSPLKVTVNSTRPYGSVSFPCWSYGDYRETCVATSMDTFVPNFYGAIVAEMS